MTFEEMCKLDPMLKRLLEEAQIITRKQSGSRGDKEFCKMAMWHGLIEKRGIVGLKVLLEQRVGFKAPVEALRNSDAHDVACHTIFDALPPCAHSDDEPCKYKLAQTEEPPIPGRE